MEKKNSVRKFIDIAIVCFITAIILLFMNLLTKDGVFGNNPYNSYMLQAQSWLSGRLDLGKDYPHLELAIFDNKYFVSFPPFPSYVMLPFAALGMVNADSLIAFISALLAGVYAVKILYLFGKKGFMCIFTALFVTIGSNWLFTATVPWVWFIAQNMAFTLSLTAIYYALKNKAGLSLALWACAVGCRPFQAIYVVVLLYILYTRKKELAPNWSVLEILKNNLKCFIAPAVIAVSYMLLNYMRFGNILEFGHNYLPEFTRTQTGQFNIAYLAENIPKLFRLPIIDNGQIKFQSAEGFCIFIASPIFIAYVVYLVKSIADKNETRKIQLAVLFSLFIVHLLMITLHRTMGGSHYGNRYTNDLLPFVFLSLAYTVKRSGIFCAVNLIPFIAGFLLNITWIILYYI